MSRFVVDQIVDNRLEMPGSDRTIDLMPGTFRQFIADIQAAVSSQPGDTAAREVVITADGWNINSDARRVCATYRGFQVRSHESGLDVAMRGPMGGGSDPRVAPPPPERQWTYQRIVDEAIRLRNARDHEQLRAAMQEQAAREAEEAERIRRESGPGEPVFYQGQRVQWDPVEIAPQAPPNPPRGVLEILRDHLDQMQGERGRDYDPNTPIAVSPTFFGALMQEIRPFERLVSNRVEGPNLVVYGHPVYPTDRSYALRMDDERPQYSNFWWHQAQTNVVVDEEAPRPNERMIDLMQQRIREAERRAAQDFNEQFANALFATASDQPRMVPTPRGLRPGRRRVGYVRSTEAVVCEVFAAFDAKAKELAA